MNIDTPVQHKLRDLMIDLVFASQPETEEHFQERCRAVEAVREELRAAGYEIPQEHD